MLTFFKSVLSYFWDESDTDLSLDEAYNILDSARDEIEEESSKEKPQVEDADDYSCYHKTGVITASQNGYFTIDDVYEFKSSLQNLKVGMEVSFTIFTSGSEVKVSDVAIKDDWHYEPHGEKSSWCIRSFICKINKREGRQISVTPGDLTLDLNNISSEFIPIVGDWVELQAKVELDENVSDLFGKILEVEKIRPLRPRILEGLVKQWCNEAKAGVIDRVVYFHGDALTSGYVPIVGDRVIAEVIESDQGRYTCRALKILPEKLTEQQVSLIDTTLTDFETEKEGVCISSNILIYARKLGETHKFVIEVLNKSSNVLILLSVNLPSNNSQCEILKPMSLTNINITPGGRVKLEGLCTVKNMGTTRELVLFSFINYKIGRWITVNLESNKSQNDKARSADRGSFLLAKTHFKQNNGELVRGQRVSVPPRFISARLPEYPVPQKLLNFMVMHEEDRTQLQVKEELRIAKPCLTLPFAFNTYEDRFHTLLHLEEIQQLIAIKNYAQDQALFIRNGEYLMLEIENLSEKRPSLMIGDRILAKDSYDADAVEFEGFVHKVGAKHVYIKFAQSFHDNYNGEDMSIMAVAGRTTFRKMHQAIGLAVRNLGNTFLFPTKVVKQKPQVNFTYEKYYDSIHTTHKKIKNRDSERIESSNCDDRNGFGKREVDYNSPKNEKKISRTEKVLEALKKHALSKESTVEITSSNSLVNKLEGLLCDEENPINSNKCDDDKQTLSNYDNIENCQNEKNKTEFSLPNGAKFNQVESSTSSGTNPVKSQLLLVSPDDDQKRSKYTSKKRFHKPDFSTIESPNHTFKLDWYNKSLNYYQKEAVRNILLGESRPLPYFIFGPPGTGKTVTLVETILQLLRLIPHSRLLVATPSNSAADLIALRLVDSGVLKPGDLVRLVAYRCVVEDMLPVKLIPYCATADIAREGTSGHTFTVTDSGLTLGCNSSVIGRHRITVGTCASLGVLYNMGFSKGHFTHIVVDEAGQATEPEVMIPFSFLDVISGQIILAGDPLQLGPVVSSKAAIEYGLEETFLDRMLSRFPYVRDSQGFPDTGGYDPRLVTRLVYNYRSLPDILTLSSNLFYDGQLISTISPEDSDEARLLHGVKEILPIRKNSDPFSVVFHGVIGENLQTSDCPSWFNPNEASQIFFYVNELYRLGLKSTDIGIISPYIKQVRQIRALLNEAEFEIPKVGTVEEFQGQEFNVILLSTVRSSESFREHDLKYKLGFLSNPRRVNVAITRAQALIIIVGNPHLLCVDPRWRSVIKYCIDNGAYCGCDLPYSD